MKTAGSTREILIVGPSQNSDSLKARLSQHLAHAFKSFPGGPYSWSFEGVADAAALKTFVTEREVPFLVILDPASHELETVCKGLRAIDPLVCILVVASSSTPTAEIGIGWLDLGASGLLNLDAPEASTEDALRDMLSQPLRVKFPRKLRVNAKHRVKLQLASLEQAIVAETLNVGLGGLFIRVVPPNVAIGDDIEFVLEFTPMVSGKAVADNLNPLVHRMNEDEAPQGKLESIRGRGNVVWVRSTAQNDVPEGIGLEFKNVDPAGLKKIQEFVASHRIKAFIPKL
ncbi:MAG: PilZ domain-containing protein [Bdellovibrionota bacterium]